MYAIISIYLYIRKMELTKNGNFCLLLQMENRNGKLPSFSANGKR